MSKVNHIRRDVLSHLPGRRGPGCLKARQTGYVEHDAGTREGTLMNDGTRRTVRNSLIALLTTGIAAGIGAFAHLVRSADPHVTRKTMFGPAVVATLEGESGERVRVLFVGRSIQSGTYLEPGRRFDPPFEYYRAFDRMFEEGAVPGGVSRVLALGGGGYAWPKHAIAHHPEVSVDVVEVDPAITRIARDHFFLDELIEKTGCVRDGRLGLISADARAYLGVCDKTYDVVIGDCFRAADPYAPLATADGVRAVRGVLREGGLYLANVVVGRDPVPLQQLCEVLATAFKHVWVLPCTDESFSTDDNYLVLATDADHVFEGAIPYEVSQ